MSKSKMMTTKQAADLLGLTTDYVRRMCASGALTAEKFNSDWQIKETDVTKLAASRLKQRVKTTEGSNDNEPAGNDE
jgi:excisionase family DNA binding protein